MKTPIKILFLSCAAWLLCSCSPSQKEPDKIDQISLEEFLLTTSDLPVESWTTKGSNDVVLDRERTADHLFISFFSDLYQEEICLSQEVFRYSSIKGAKRDFNYASTYFKLPDIPDEWMFQSEKACESYIGCSEYNCYWIARYDRIVIDVRLRRDSNCMEISELEKVIITIDERANKLINNND